jgi:hypothetical protein
MFSEKVCGFYKNYNNGGFDKKSEVLSKIAMRHFEAIFNGIEGF